MCSQWYTLYVIIYVINNVMKLYNVYYCNNITAIIDMTDKSIN